MLFVDGYHIIRIQMLQPKNPTNVGFLYLVGEEGFEPSSQKAADFKSAVYTVPPYSHMFTYTSVSTLALMIAYEDFYQQ